MVLVSSDCTAPGEIVVVGHAGELHPAACERLGLPARTCAVELDLTAIGAREVLPAPTISSFPSVNQDVALVVDVAVPAAATLRRARVLRWADRD